MSGQVYSQGFENEADYIGLYILANTKYDINKAQHYWRKMSAQMPSGLNQSYFSTHPSNPERYLRMKKAIKEINSKRAHATLIQPSLKKDKFIDK